MLCIFCKDLSISQLIELAEVELWAHDFPQKAYYQHHGSYTDLIKSANDGCDLCKIIYQAFQETVLDSFPNSWEGSTMDTALQEIGSRGHPTDLKICLNAAHLYSRQKLEDLKLFDVFMVQAGIIGPVDPGEEEIDYENRIPPLELIINVSGGVQKFIGKYRVGRYKTNSDLGSTANHELARSWMNDCTNLHKDCTSSKLSKLPTRVIDVGKLNGSKNPKLFVSNETEGDYVALSHCWGGVISPLLTTENLIEFQTSITFSNLPANFRDAIIITRELGIQYLWIDSLCIIQDSKLDWDIESKKMCSIYRDCKVMISAAASSGSTVGILKHSHRKETIENVVPLKLFADPNLDEVVYISKKHEAPQDFRDLLLSSPLTSRGWTLQEGLLAPRILHYGNSQIYWQCQQGFQSADGMAAGNLMPEDEAYPELAKLVHSRMSLMAQEHNVESILEEYYTIVSAYTRRRLTFDSDKLPAFSGIAEILHQALGGDYLAGIWTRDLQSLLWYRENQDCKHVAQYRAPSWSWAVTNQPVTFQNEKCEGYQDAYDAQLVSRQIGLKAQNYYGEVESGQLVLKGFTKKLVRSIQIFVDMNKVEDQKYNHGTIWYDDEPTSGRILHIQDHSEKYLLSVVELLRFQAEKEGIEPGEDWNINPDLFLKQSYIAFFIKSRLDKHLLDTENLLYQGGAGLILAQVNGKDSTYARVGYFVLEERYKPNFESWMESWERQEIAII